MATWPDPRSIGVGFAFGHTQYEDPSALDYEQLAPDPDDEGDPGPVLGPVTWTRGRIGDAPETDATRIDLALRNTDGEFSPRNLTGPRYGTLRPGTPLQVTLDVGSGPQVLATANALGFEPVWDGPGIDERVPVRGFGALNRLGRDQVSRSALSHTILGGAYSSVNTTPVEYWPMEDGPLAGQFASAISGRLPMTAVDATPASVDDLPGSGPVVLFGATTTVSAAVVGEFPDISATFQWAVAWLMKFDTLPGSATTLMDVAVPDGRPATRWVVSISGSNVTISAYDTFGALVESQTDSTTTIVAGEWYWFAISVANSATPGAGVLSVRSQVEQVALVSTSAVVVGAGRPTNLTVPASSALVDAAMGHLYAGRGAPLSFVDSPPTAMDAYVGETARDRIARLADEAGIPADILAADSSLMGEQQPGTILGLMREAEDVDGGVLYELRDGRLAFQALDARLNQDPALTLDFGTEAEPGDVSDLIQFDDDRDTYNVVTAIAPDGSYAVAEQVDGPVGSDTATGIGPRPVTVTRNVFDPSQLKHQAGWVLRKGSTAPVLRIPANAPGVTVIPVGGATTPARLAAHEAGHGVLAVLLGVDVGGSWIEGSEGYTATRPAEPWTDALISAAGAAVIVGSLSDADLRQMLRSIPPNRVNEAISAARAILKDHRAALAAVARELHRDGQISGARITEIVRTAAPTPGPRQPS